MALGARVEDFGEAGADGGGAGDGGGLRVVAFVRGFGMEEVEALAVITLRSLDDEVAVEQEDIPNFQLD